MDESLEEVTCVFCQIVDKNMSSDVVFEGSDTLFFNDIAPKAPVHIVGITKKHISSLNEVELDDKNELGQLLVDTANVAKNSGLSEDGYRVISNVGKNAGQEVKHFHIHILGGESLGPLRC